MTKERLNYLLLCAMGNKELVDRWWQSPNLAFDSNTPEKIYTDDPKRVEDYIVRAVNVGGDYY